MKQAELAERSLAGASSLPGLFAAAWTIFELLMQLAEADAAAAPEMYPALTLARGAAAQGRNAIAFAPSMPAVYAAPPEGLVPGAASVSEAADTAARLAALLGTRLQDAARAAADPGDRAACEDASGHAGRVCALLGRGG